MPINSVKKVNSIKLTLFTTRVLPTGLARREGSDVRDIARAGLARIAGATKLTALASLAAAGALALPATAPAATVPAPTIATSFTPNQIDVTGSSSVQYSVNVSSGTVNNVTFTDVLPAGVVVDSPATETDAGCTSSTVSAPVVTYTATPGTSTITVSVPQVKAGTPCTVQFPVVGNAVGNGSDSFAPGSFTYATSATGGAIAAPTTGETTASIQVIPQPTVTVSGVKAGTKYKFGQAVAVKYTCLQPGLIDGIVTCGASDDLGHNVKSGGKLPTTKPGKHALTFQVVDALGDVVSDEIDYAVLPDNRITIDRVTKHSAGSLGFTLALPGPGVIAIKVARRRQARLLEDSEDSRQGQTRRDAEARRRRQETARRRQDQGQAAGQLHADRRYQDHRYEGRGRPGVLTPRGNTSLGAAPGAWGRTAPPPYGGQYHLWLGLSGEAGPRTQGRGPTSRDRPLQFAPAMSPSPLAPKHRSRILTDGPERAAARAYLKGIGYDDEAM